jgi:hypothetical protein
MPAHAGIHALSSRHQGRRGNPEDPLDVRVRRRTSVHQRTGMNERQILALPGRENRESITGHAIHRCRRQPGISDEHTLPGGTDRGGTRATTRLSSLFLHTLHIEFEPVQPLLPDGPLFAKPILGHDEARWHQTVAALATLLR